MPVTYNDIQIWSLDQNYIDNLEREFDIDGGEAVLWSLESGRAITNDIIDYIQTEAVYQLDISEEGREKLFEWMYTNSIDSWFCVDEEDFSEEDWEVIEDFIELF